MSRIKRKRKIEVEIEFSTPTELNRILADLNKMVKNGVEEYKEYKDGIGYQYKQEYKPEEIKHFRYEEINGKNYLILPSKMNHE